MYDKVKEMLVRHEGVNVYSCINVVKIRLDYWCRQKLIKIDGVTEEEAMYLLR